MNIRIAIASDLHVMAPELLIAPGAASERALRSDRKLLVESAEITRQLVRELLDHKVDLVLIPGDLTKDGELVSHRLVASLLSPLLEAGIRTYVIPGNHDIYNPLAATFDGEERLHTDYITPDDFAEIYADYGYDTSADDIIERGPRLSYLAEPTPGLWICAVDSNIYDTNIADNYPMTLGSLTPETLKYGARRSLPDGSISLHARRLTFVHPVSKEVVDLVAPYPEGTIFSKFTPNDAVSAD